MREIVKVNGVSCGHCVSAIEESVGKLVGVSNVDVELASGEVTVQFNEPTTVEKIKETIEEQGYDVVS